MNEHLGESMDDCILNERARSVERWARLFLVHEANIDDVRLALHMLHGTLTALASRYEHQLTDANGRVWEERVDALDRMIRHARDGQALRDVLRVVIGDMRPLTGSERLEECLS